MAKKRKKAALPRRLNPQEVDFYLYKSEPHTTGSLRSGAEKSFDKDEQLVAFYNGNDNPIRLSFLGPLQASPNPLAISPGDTGEVKINPVAPGRFPCRVEILLAICPTCSSTLKGSDVLKVRPERLAAMDPTASLYCQDESGEDDADPIIIIKPQ